MNDDVYNKLITFLFAEETRLSNQCYSYSMNAVSSPDHNRLFQYLKAVITKDYFDSLFKRLIDYIGVK